MSLDEVLFGIIVVPAHNADDMRVIKYGSILRRTGQNIGVFQSVRLILVSAAAMAPKLQQVPKGFWSLIGGTIPDPLT